MARMSYKDRGRAVRMMAAVTKYDRIVSVTTKGVIPRGCTLRGARGLHTTCIKSADFDDYNNLAPGIMKPPKKFTTYNDVVYPPTKEGEEPRPAEYCHVKKVAGCPKKFWYAATLVRGLSIDEAIQQCDFSKKAYPKIIKEVLLEAQASMLNECNVEFPSNMWVADSFCTKGGYAMSISRGYRGMKKVYHKKTNYFLRLREGQPPEHYYPPEATGYEKLEEYVHEQRQRRIKNSL